MAFELRTFSKRCWFAAQRPVYARLSRRHAPDTVVHALDRTERRKFVRLLQRGQCIDTMLPVPHRVSLRAPLGVRPVVARATAQTEERVFTDDEWEAAIQTSAKAMRAAEAAPVQESVNGSGDGVLSEKPTGKSFSDEEWEEVLQRAPALLDDLQQGPPAASSPQEDALEDAVVTSGRTFTDAQWDAAIKLAQALETAEARKAAIDAEIEELRELTSAPPPAQPDGGSPTGTNFAEVMAFSGPAPEVINGRLAMLGFIAAAGAEIASKVDVLTQLRSATAPVVGAAALLAIASLTPMLRGVSRAERSAGPFTAHAEMINGRAAMIGFVALIVLEYTRDGAPLF